MKWFRNFLLILLVFSVLFLLPLQNLRFLPQIHSVKASPAIAYFYSDSNDDDAHVYGADPDYATARSTAFFYQTNDIYTGQRDTLVDYYVYRAFIKFNTTALPEIAIILSVELCIHGMVDGTAKDFIWRVQNWTGDTPIDTGDYNQYDGTNYDDGNFNTADYLADDWNNITISNTSIIVKAGYTKVCLRSSKDISATVPTDDESEYVLPRGYGLGEPTNRHPRLKIVYTAGSEVTLNSPLHDAKIENRSSVDFKYTPVFYEAIQNSSLYTNVTGIWAITQANTTTVTNNTENTITYTFNSDGVYIWNVGVYNSTMEIFADSNYTVIIETFYNYVDNNTSDVDSSTDKGTHSDFDSEKAVDGLDTLTEVDSAPIENDTEDFVDNNTSDKDSNPDKGTHSNFTTQQYYDSTYDTLTEAGTTTGDGSEWLSVDDFDETVNNWDANVGTDPWISTQDEPNNYICELSSGDVEIGWFSFPDTTLTGTITANISIYGKNMDGVGDDWADVVVDYLGGSGSDKGDACQHLTYSYDTFGIGDLTVTQVNALRVKFVYKKSGGGDAVFIDHVRIGLSSDGVTNYELDIEVQWTSADYDETTEYLCIYTGTQDAEALKVDVWTGSWTNIIADLSASTWNNVSIGSYLTSSEFTIRFKGATETGDTTESTWQIECSLLHVYSTIVQYELDLEIQWTNANYTRTNEELCIKTGTTDAEDIKVDWWNTTSSSWVNIASDLTTNSWNNISVSTYLTASMFTLRYKGGTETSDTNQDSWQIDCALLHTWEAVEEDTTAPTYSNVGTNTTVAGQPCLFHVKCTDETGLATTGGYIYGTNNTGTPTNDTWVAFSSNPDWANVTKTLNTTIHIVVQWWVYFNDTSDNWNNTGTQPFTTTTTFQRSTDQPLTIQPVPSRLTSYTRVIPQPLQILLEASRKASYSRLFNQPFSILTSVTRQISYYRTTEQKLSILTETARKTSYSRVFSQPLSILSEVIRQTFYSRLFNQQLPLEATATRKVSLPRTAELKLSILTETLRKATYSRTSLQPLQVLLETSRKATYTRIFNQPLDILFSIHRKASYHRTVNILLRIKTQSIIKIPAPPPPPPPPPPYYVTPMRLDLIIEKPTMISYLWWRPTFTAEILVVNKGTVTDDVTFQWMLLDENNVKIAWGTLTMFISGLDEKRVYLNIATPEKTGTYTLSFQSIAPIKVESESSIKVATPFYGSIWLTVIIMVIAISVTIILVVRKPRLKLRFSP